MILMRSHRPINLLLNHIPSSLPSISLYRWITNNSTRPFRLSLRQRFSTRFINVMHPDYLHETEHCVEGEQTGCDQHYESSERVASHQFEYLQPSAVTHFWRSDGLDDVENELEKV